MPNIETNKLRLQQALKNISQTEKVRQTDCAKFITYIYRYVALNQR